MKIKAGGVWLDADPKVKVSGTWTDVNKGWVKVGGVWQQGYARYSEVTHNGSLSSDATYYYIDFAANLFPSTSPTSHNYTLTVAGKPLAVDYLIVGQGGNGNDGVLRGITVYPTFFAAYTLTPYGGFSGGGGGVLSGSTTLGTGSYPISLHNRAYTDISNSRGGDTTAFGLTALGGGRGGYWGGAPAAGTYASQQDGQDGGSGGAGAAIGQVGLGTAGQGTNSGYISVGTAITDGSVTGNFRCRSTQRMANGYANGGGAGGAAGAGNGYFDCQASLSSFPASIRDRYNFPSSVEAVIGDPVTILGLTVSNGGNIGPQNYSNYGAGGQGFNGTPVADNPGGRGGIVRIRYLRSAVGG